ncbi:MAG: extracellular matrix/biofilm biosynthesis regulator RemA family protein [Gemmiger sp.]
MKLINIGFGNMVNADRVIAAVSPDSAPVKRIVQDAREKGSLIDASYGRRTRAVLIMDSDHVILSGIPLESIAGRAGLEEKTEENKGEV